MVDKKEKGVIYYEIRPTERLYKQVMGLLFYMNEAHAQDKNLVLPFFKLGDPLPNTTEYEWYDFNQIFDWWEINKAPIGFVQPGGFPDPVAHADNPSFRDPANIIVLDSVNQLPYGNPLHTKWRQYISINKRIENAARRNTSSALQKDKIYQYLAVHWRQDDFLRVRPQVTMNAKELVELIKLRLKETTLEHVYIATDCKSQKDLDYIHANLNTFTVTTKGLHNEHTSEPDDPIYIAAQDILICSWSTYFIGTWSSSFTSFIRGERDKLNIPQGRTEIINNDELKNAVKE